MNADEYAIDPGALVESDGVTTRIKCVITGLLNNRSGPAIFFGQEPEYYLNGVKLDYSHWLDAIKDGITPNYNKYNQTTKWYNNQLNLHRTNAPAAIMKEHSIYYLNGKIHREDGPAYIRYNHDGSVKSEEFWLYDYAICRNTHEAHQLFGPNVVGLGGRNVPLGPLATHPISIEIYEKFVEKFGRNNVLARALIILYSNLTKWEYSYKYDISKIYERALELSSTDIYLLSNRYLDEISLKEAGLLSGCEKQVMRSPHPPEPSDTDDHTTDSDGERNGIGVAAILAGAVLVGSILSRNTTKTIGKAHEHTVGKSV